MAGMVEKVEKMGTQKGYAETRTPNHACHPLSDARAPQNTSYTIRPYKQGGFVNLSGATWVVELGHSVSESQLIV